MRKFRNQLSQKLRVLGQLECQGLVLFKTGRHQLRQSHRMQKTTCDTTGKRVTGTGDNRQASP